MTSHLGFIPGREIPPAASYVTLSNLATVSRQFHAVANPILYHDASIFTGCHQPYPPLTFLGTPSERLLRHVRTLQIGLYHVAVQNQGLNTARCNYLRHYLIKCYRFLQSATALQNIDLRFQVFDLKTVPRVLRHQVKLINHLIFRILRYVYRLPLRHFKLEPRQGSTITPVLRILEGKVTALCFNSIEFNDWIDRLANCNGLRALMVSRVHYGSKAFDDAFWTGLSNLPNLRSISCDGVPFSSSLKIQFPYLVSLKLHISYPVTAVDWVSSVEFILSQMPNLENLSLSVSSDHYGTIRDGKIKDITGTIDITTFNCRKLKSIHWIGYAPKYIIAAIGMNCLDLQDLHFKTHASIIDDDHLRSLSRCTQLQKLSLPNPTEITDLSCLSLLRKLRELELHYSMRRYITSDFLVALARGCPQFHKILVSDTFTPTGTYDFQPSEAENIPIDFAVGQEMFGYIKATRIYTWRYRSTYRSDQYIIHVDRLRKDRALGRL